MLAADPQQLRQPVTPDSPVGSNLEYDARFMEMSRLAEGTREQQYGNTIIAAHPPDWRGALQIADELAGETRDLRVAVMIIEGLAHTDGIDGLAEGFELLQHWICGFWNDIHPQLDETDGRDPFVRINTLGRLCDSERLLSLINKIPLVEAPPHMLVTLSDVRWANGNTSGQPSTASDRATPMEIEAAFLALPLGELRHRYETCLRAENALVATIDFLEQTCGKGVWDATALIGKINACTDLLKQQLRLRLSASDAVVADVSAANKLRHDDGHDSNWGPHSIDQSITSLSRIRVDSRDEAEQVIEAATQYFERYEPSSPVPLLLRRAKRMINQDFVDILRDLAPGALEQAKTLTGDLDE
tara:strand:+ start:22739 stop:23815 length:1077 start_codon:yes stop_codon:yes gene_type:complete